MHILEGAIKYLKSHPTDLLNTLFKIFMHNDKTDIWCELGGMGTRELSG